MALSLTAEGTGLVVGNRNLLELARKRLTEGDVSIVNAVRELKEEADQALHEDPFTIVDKAEMPPSGDKHDYVSMGPYWWPNSDTVDGLPYIRRDGMVNPESELDRQTLTGMTRAVGTLSLGWFFCNRIEYADRAVQLLRVFFLEEQSRMNPHLEFGQAIPGVCDGRGIGIIETTPFATELIDSISLLLSSSRLTQEDFDGLRSWFSQYLDWLLQSPNGLDEQQMHNNHGTTYDVQVTVFSLFVGKDRIARDTLASVAQKRIIPQIESDGRQPHELTRTNALGYSTMNLGLLFNLAEVAAQLGMDLWHFESSDNRSIRQALDWLIPFWVGQQAWPYQQISTFETDKAHNLLCRGALAYGSSAYKRAATSLSSRPYESTRFKSNLSLSFQEWFNNRMQRACRQIN